MDLLRAQAASIGLLAMMLSLGVLCDGVVTIQPDSDLLVPLGASGTFLCEADRDGLLNLVLMAHVSDSEMYTYNERSVAENESVPLGTVSYISRSSLGITILATEEHNGTEVSCKAIASQTFFSETVRIIVQGAPLPPEPIIMSVNLTTLTMSWMPPFTWEDYPITGYQSIVYRDNSSISSSSHDHMPNETAITYSRDDLLEEDDSGCIELEFRVTANNDLGNSSEGTVTGGYPIVPGPFDNTSLNVTVYTSDMDINILLKLYFKLPMACTYQTATVTIDVTSAEPNQTAMTFGPYTFSYSSVDDIVSITIQDPSVTMNEEYSLMVTVDTGGGLVSSESLQFSTQSPSSAAAASTWITMIILPVLVLICS